MRTIRVLEHVSLDGIIQGPGGPEEDREGGFAHGGWAFPFGSEEGGKAVLAAQGESFDLLLGRKTYDIFGSYWPRQTGLLADRLNAANKYVATHQSETLDWGPAEDLGPDISAGVAALKSTDGPDLIVWGSSTIAPILIAEELADELVLFIAPVLVGYGKRLFSEVASPSQLSLLSSQQTSTGVLINRYKPTGALRTGSF